MNQTKILMLIAVGLLSVGCDVNVTPQSDQCLRQQIFLQCMNALPAGPNSTKYNDWDEVVAECGSVAYYQSLRSLEAGIKPECRV